MELLGCPVLLCPAPERGTELPGAVGVREAAGLLSSRFVPPGGRRRLDPVSGTNHQLQEWTHDVCVSLSLCLSRCRGQRLTVRGRVASVCALLRVAGTSFFFFSLTDGAHTLPVLVKVGRWSLGRLPFTTS